MASDTTLSPAEARDLEIIRSSGGVPAELELLFAKHWRSLPLNDLLANVNDLCDIFWVQRTNMTYSTAKAGEQLPEAFARYGENDYPIDRLWFRADAEAYEVIRPKRRRRHGAGA